MQFENHSINPRYTVSEKKKKDGKWTPLIVGLLYQVSPGIKQQQQAYRWGSDRAFMQLLNFLEIAARTPLKHNLLP